MKLFLYEYNLNWLWLWCYQNQSWICNHPRSPSASTGIVVGHCVMSGVRPSVCLSWTTLPLLLFKDFSYQPEIWWDDAQYHEANRFLAMFVQLRAPRNFEIFHDRLGPGRWNWGNDITAWNLVAWCSSPRSGALNGMKWPHSAKVCIFWSRPAEGAVVLWTSCKFNSWNLVIPVAQFNVRYFKPVEHIYANTGSHLTLSTPSIYKFRRKGSIRQCHSW